MDPATLKTTLVYLDKLAACETAVADFYDLCAAYWPEEEVWAALVPQEREHAELLLKVRELVASAPFEFTPSRSFSPAALDTFLSAVAAYRHRVAKGLAGKPVALSLSLDIERSIIESRYETLMLSANTEYKRILSRLISDTAVHRELFKARVNQIKFRK